jgi:hypothetical protein
MPSGAMPAPLHMPRTLFHRERSVQKEFIFDAYRPEELRLSNLAERGMRSWVLRGRVVLQDGYERALPRKIRLLACLSLNCHKQARAGVRLRNTHGVALTSRRGGITSAGWAMIAGRVWDEWDTLGRPIRSNVDGLHSLTTIGSGSKRTPVLAPVPRSTGITP